MGSGKPGRIQLTCCRVSITARNSLATMQTFACSHRLCFDSSLLESLCCHTDSCLCRHRGRHQVIGLFSESLTISSSQAASLLRRKWRLFFAPLRRESPLYGVFYLPSRPTLFLPPPNLGTTLRRFHSGLPPCFPKRKDGSSETT